MNLFVGIALVATDRLMMFRLTTLSRKLSSNFDARLKQYQFKVYTMAISREIVKTSRRELYVL